MSHRTADSQQAPISAHRPADSTRGTLQTRVSLREAYFHYYYAYFSGDLLHVARRKA